MMLGACREPELSSGLGKEMLTGVRGELGEREWSIVLERISDQKVLLESSFGPTKHVWVRGRATLGTDSGVDKWA